MVNQLGSTHASHQVRALGVCYDFRETSHWSSKSPLYRIISHSIHLDQSCRDVVPSVKGGALSASVSDSYVQFEFRSTQIHTFFSILGL